MKTRIKTAALISITLITINLATAQDPPPPPGDPSIGGGPVGGGAPIGEGIVFLSFMAAAYGGKKAFNKPNLFKR